MNPNAQFEQDLEQWLQTELPASAPAGFHASVMDRARTLRQRPGWATTLPARRLGRGRGMTLLAAAALLGGGALAAGSGILRLPSVVPPVPAPSVVAVATASPDATSPSPSESAAPSASPIPVAGPGGVWIPTGTMVTPRLDTPRCGSSMAGCSSWAGRGGESDPDLRGAVRPGHAGPGPPPGASQMPLGLAASCCSTARCSFWSWTAPTVIPTVQRCTTRPAGPGPPPVRWIRVRRSLTTRSRCSADGRVLLAGREGAQVYDPASGTWTVHRSDGSEFGASRHVHGAPRRPGPGGWWGRRPGVRPGQWDLDRHRDDERPGLSKQRPPSCPTARSSLRAAAASRRPTPTTTLWTRPRYTTPSRGPGPRSRTCTRRP